MSTITAPTVPVDLTPYPWPFFAEDEVSAVADVMRSGKVNYWTGKVGRTFETEFANEFQVSRAVAMANGTVTLQACLRALGIGDGDEVITTPRTFIGTSSAVVMEGARPVLTDVDPESGNITADTIERVVTSRSKAILPVHLSGWPCEMDAIMEVARQHNLVVIEDCAQSHGATYNGRQLGSIGHVASWSFCQDKIITTGGEGGMVGTNDDELWARMWSVKDHGKSYETVYSRQHPPGFRWLHEGWGTNWRLTEMQSAIGLKQLEKLPEWKRIRTRNARILEDRLAECSCVRVPRVPPHMEHAYYKLYAYVRPESLKSDWNRDRILAAFAERGVPGLSGTCSEIYLEKSFTDHGYGLAERLPIARQLGETSLMFLVHPTLTEDAMHLVGDHVMDVLRKAQR